MTTVPQFKERMLELAKRYGYNYTAFAKALGYSQQTVNYWLNGKRVPDAPNLIEISKKMDVSMDWLLGLSDVPSPDTSIRAAADYTGLSQRSVETLHRKSFAGGFYTSDDEESIEIHHLIDILISSPEGQNFLLNAVGYFTSNTSDIYVDNKKISPDRISFNSGAIGGLIPFSSRMLNRALLDLLTKDLEQIKNNYYKDGDH